MPLTRRATLLGLGLTASLGNIRFALADAPVQKRFIVVLQRGAMDGMSAVVPYGDPNLISLRPSLIPPAPGQPGGMFDLGGFYGLSPNFPNMAAMYQGGEMLPILAVAGPYRTRSHFEAQDLLQLGTEDSSITSGWLNRALAELPARNGSSLLGLGPASARRCCCRGRCRSAPLRRSISPPRRRIWRRVSRHSMPVTRCLARPLPRAFRLRISTIP